MAHLAERGRAKLVQDAAVVDALLRQMGQSAQQVPSVRQDGPADLPVHRRADRHTDETAQFPMSELDRLTCSATPPGLGNVSGHNRMVRTIDTVLVDGFHKNRIGRRHR